MSSFVKTLKYGMPFLCFMVLGSFLLREFTLIRYDIYTYKRKYRMNPNLHDEDEDDNHMKLIEKSVDSTGDKDSQAETRKISRRIQEKIRENEQLEDLKKLGQNEWKNIRGPRPWEDNKEFEEMIKNVQEKKKR